MKLLIAKNSKIKILNRRREVATILSYTQYHKSNKENSIYKNILDWQNNLRKKG